MSALLILTVASGVMFCSLWIGLTFASYKFFAEQEVIRIQKDIDEALKTSRELNQVADEANKASSFMLGLAVHQHLKEKETRAKLRVKTFDIVAWAATIIFALASIAALVMLAIAISL